MEVEEGKWVRGRSESRDSKMRKIINFEFFIRNNDGRVFCLPRLFVRLGLGECLSPGSGARARPRLVLNNF